MTERNLCGEHTGLCERIISLEKDQVEIKKDLKWTVRLILATLFAVIGQILIKAALYGR